MNQRDVDSLMERNAHQNVALPPVRIEAVVGPEYDEFWNGRVEWVANYRKTNKATIRESMDAWESLAKVGMFDPRPNPAPCAKGGKQ